MDLEKSEAFSILDKVLELSPADQTEGLLLGHRTALTRYANSVIHQNVLSKDLAIMVRLVFDKRIGIARTNRTDDVSLRQTVERATRMAKAQRPNKDFISLPEGGKSAQVKGYSPKTADSLPEDRAKVVEDVVSIVKSSGGSKAFGALEASSYSFAVANSVGARAFGEMTTGHLTVTAIREHNDQKGYGWGEDLNVDISKIDHTRMALQAAEKAEKSVIARRIEPGEYDVVLEDYAVADMVLYLSYIVFGALPYQEKRSYISGRLGQRVTGESVTLWDEGTRPGGLPLAFDAEGVPKEKVMLLEDGVARNVVYDSYTAGREGRKSTGHALPPPNTTGPLAVNPFLKTGDSDLEEMVADTKGGVYVTRFHYTNPVDAPRALITGMTRDGTFLIENGEIVGSVRNLRFTQGLMEAFSRATLVGKAARPHRFSSWLGIGASTVPPAKIEAFKFTGVTEF